MLDYTRIAINKTVTDLKRLAFWFTVIMQIMMIGFPIYSIVVKSGVLYLNILLSLLALAFLVFYILQNKGVKISKEQTKQTKTAYKVVKYINKIYSVGISVYGVYVATEHTTLVSIVYVGVMVIGLLLGLVLDLVISFLANKVEFIVTAIEADIEEAKRPIDKVQGVFDRIRGKEVTVEEAAPTKARIILDERVSEYRAQVKLEKSEAKAKKAELRRQKIKSIFKKKTSEGDSRNIEEREESSVK